MSRAHIEALRAAREAEHKAVDLRYDALERLSVPSGDVVIYDRDHLPPGFRSKEAFAGEARRLGFGATFKVGHGWSIPAFEWNARRGADREKRRRDRAPVRGVGDPIDQLLERSGLRLVGKASGR